MKMTYSLTIMLSILLALTGHAIAQNTISKQKPAMIASLENKTLEQHKIIDCATAQSPVEWKGMTINHSENGLTLSGYDHNGGTWQATIPAGSIMSCEVWAATLAKGQPEDVIVFNRDENKYDSQLTILRFNRDGRPMPWLAHGNFNVTAKGVTQIVQDSTTGNAGVIVPQREGDRHSGYAYVYHLIAVSPTGMQKELGEKYSAQWPIITGNRKFLSGTETRDTLSEQTDTSATAMSAQAGEGVTLESVIPPGKGPDGLGSVALSNGKSIMFPSILVVDSRLGNRSIYFAGDVPDQLEKMTNSKYSVRLEGTTCEEEECRPLLLIAKQQD